MLSEAILSQVGLTIVYLGTAVLLAFLQRIERSPALRLWMVTFMLFGVDSALSALISYHGWPDAWRGLAWLALLAGSIAGVVGTVRFIGGRVPRSLALLGGMAAVAVVLATLIGVSPDGLRGLSFGAIAGALVWAGVLAFRGGVPGGAGRWVLSGAFLAAGAYAVSWPVVCHWPLVSRLEFFYDLLLVLWGLTGMLMMHFERAREKVRELAAQELELRERLERAERVEALGRLASGVAHDINNVLTIIINGTELALNQVADRPQATARLRGVLDAAEGAAGFTRQLLALGRRRLPGRSPVLVNESVERALGMVRSSLPQGIELRWRGAEERLAVKASRGQLEQVVVNLVLNAADAMPDGGLIELGTSSDEASPNGVRLVVADTGHGMDAPTRAHLFEPFFSTKEHHRGTGLGLAAVHAIVQQLGGSIAVESEPGAGTVFTIELPACEPPAPAARTSDYPSGNDRTRPEQVRILVVDDQQQVLDSVTAGLRDAGFQVDGCVDTDEALARAEQCPPDVLLSDVCMPGLRGTELAARLRRRDPSLRVILMTGNSSDEEIESQRGQTAWLAKPFTSQQLRRLVDGELAKRAVRDRPL